MQLVLERPIAAAAHDRFVLRDTTAQRTIAGGRFLDLRAPARKRRTPERLAQLDAHAIEDPDAALAALLDRAPWYVDLAAFARDRALGQHEIDAAVAARRRDPHRRARRSACRPRSGCASSARSLPRSTAFHADHPDLPGIGLERLRLQLEPRLPAPAFLPPCCRALARAHEIALDGAGVRLPSHDVRLTPADEKLWTRIRPLLGGASASVRRACTTSPPRSRCRKPTCDACSSCSAAWARSTRSRRIISSCAPPSPRWWRSRVDVAAQAEDGQFTAAQFRDRLDNGRKVAIQILEFFDRHGVTLRRGDLRRINPQRLDLFRRPAEETPAFWKRSVPGGASGLQIREGPRAGPWWVRTPSLFRHGQGARGEAFGDGTARPGPTGVKRARASGTSPARAGSNCSRHRRRAARLDGDHDEEQPAWTRRPGPLGVC